MTILNLTEKKQEVFIKYNHQFGNFKLSVINNDGLIVSINLHKEVVREYKIKNFDLMRLTYVYVYDKDTKVSRKINMTKAVAEKFIKLIEEKPMYLSAETTEEDIPF